MSMIDPALDPSLRCSLTLQVLDEPVTLTCGHSVSKSSATWLYRLQSSVDGVAMHIDCPLCTEPTELLDGERSVALLPHNGLLAGLAAKAKVDAQTVRLEDVHGHTHDLHEVSIGTWLARLRLDQYTAALQNEGYEDANTLRLLGPDEVQALASKVGMKPGHSLKFESASRELQVSNRKRADPRTGQQYEFYCPATREFVTSAWRLEQQDQRMHRSPHGGHGSGGCVETEEDHAAASAFLSIRAAGGISKRRVRARAEAIGVEEEEVRGARARVLRQVPRIDASANEACDRIEAVFNEIRSVLDARETALKDAVAGEAADLTSRLNLQAREMQAAADLAAQSVKASRELLEHPDEWQAVTLEDLILQRLNSSSRIVAMASRQTPCVSELRIFEDLGSADLLRSCGSFGYVGSKKLVRPCGPSCIAHGCGLSGAVVGQRTSFTVFAKGSSGDAAHTGGDEFIVAVSQIDFGGSAVRCSVSDSGNGTYVVAYTPPRTGNLLITVTLAETQRALGGEIEGSPFGVVVEPAIEVQPR